MRWKELVRDLTGRYGWVDMCWSMTMQLYTTRGQGITNAPGLENKLNGSNNMGVKFQQKLYMRDDKQTARGLGNDGHDVGQLCVDSFQLNALNRWTLDGLVQDSSTSTTNTLETELSCNNKGSDPFWRKIYQKCSRLFAKVKECEHELRKKGGENSGFCNDYIQTDTIIPKYVPENYKGLESVQ